MSDVSTESPTEGRPQRGWSRPRVWIPVAVIVFGLVVGAAFAFQPWRLVVDQTVDEPAPAAAGLVPGTGDDVSASDTDAGKERAGPVALQSGAFISHEHETRGTATILELDDGKRVLRLEGLRTSNGPDLRVWLTDSRVIEGTSGWFVFDDGEYVDLGPLKGNVGNQNYVIPATADLDELRSVAIWCDRFSVSFGAAALSP